MLLGGLDGLYREALAGSHRQVSRVEVWRNHQRIDTYGEEGFAFLGGSVTATLRSRVTRNCTLTVHENMVPLLDDEDGLLTPYGNYLRCVRGLELGNGLRYEWPTFYGQIRVTSDSGDGTCDIQASDRAQLVDDDKFLTPRESQVGNPVRAQVIELISDADPAADFDIGMAVASQPVPQLVWEYDRARALDELATAAGCLWWAKADGTYTLARVPWATFSPPLVTLREVKQPGVLESGAIVQRAVGAISNETVINQVVAYSERLDGTTPVWASAINDNPASPTRANGPIGPRTRLLRLQTPQNEGALQGAASTYLRRGAALAEEWSWSQIVDPAMELGDVVLLAPKRRRVPVVQVVSGYTIPLNVDVEMAVTGRAMVIGSGEEDEGV